jgi:urease accessory protein
MPRGQIKVTATSHGRFGSIITYKLNRVADPKGFNGRVPAQKHGRLGCKVQSVGAAALIATASIAHARCSTPMSRAPLPTQCHRVMEVSRIDLSKRAEELAELMFDTVSPSDLAEDPSHFGSAKVYISYPPDRAGNPSDNDLQRAEGSGRIVFSGSEKCNRIIDVFQRFPIRIMLPNIDGRAVEEAVLINSAGGIAGGDQLEFDVTALANASIAVTSQAAEKVYRALDEPARITTKLKACESARLAWLPQETILFNSGQLNRETEIELSSGAELLALEWLVLGRAARGEEMVGGHIIDSWRVNKDGRLIWAESLRATTEMFPHLQRKALFSNCKAVGTLIYFGPHLDTRLKFLRDIAPSLVCHCAATSVGGVIIVRFAATVPSDLRLALHSFLQQFSRELGPGPFRVPKMWSC